ncbi:MAG: hypothetical protein WCV92_02125 [Candidatus Buchananbacteria bacterium]
MENRESTAKNILTIILIAIIIMAVAFGLSLWLTPKYKAASKLIVVFSEQGMDAYTASKNSSYITGILSEVVYSNSFINGVYDNNFSLRDDLGTSQDQRLRQWRKEIKVKTQDTKGIIIIESFSNSRDQAYQLNQSVASNLISKHGQYDGFDQKATFKVIDNPSIAENWNQVQIIQNSLIGLALGLFLGFSFVVIFPRQQIFKVFSSEYNSFVNKDETIGLGNGEAINNFTPYDPHWMDYSIPSNDPSNPSLREES